MVLVGPLALALTSSTCYTLTMELIDAHNLAMSLMAEHGLDTPSEWRFKFDGAVRRFGSCNSYRKLITLSRHLTLVNPESEVRTTILHEIAHALTPTDGHGRLWSAECRELGITPTRCYDTAGNGRAVVKIQPTWIGFCSKCQKVVGYYFRRKKLYHGGLCGGWNANAYIDYRYQDA